MNLEKTIQKCIANTIESDSGLSINKLPIKTVISTDNENAHIHLCSAFPSRALSDRLLPRLKDKLHQVIPDMTVHITIDHFIKSHKTQLTGKSIRGIKNTIAIASGKGGVGKSTVAVNLATALAKSGAEVGILDADIYGPSIPLMLGKIPKIDIVDDHYVPAKLYGVQAMSIGYLTDPESALIWRGPMLAKSLLQMLDITMWNDLDYLIIDLPPGTGDIQLSLVQKIPLTGAIIVTTPQTVATLDAQKAIKMFNKTNIDVLGIIENMSEHKCSQCGHRENIFGHGGAKVIADQFQVPLIAQLPLHTQIMKDAESGKPTAIANDPLLAEVFEQAALTTAIAIAKKPLNYADKFPPVSVES